MSKFFAFAALAFVFLSSASGLVIPRKSPPPGWAYGYLEDYTTYHIRYLALNCESQHGQPFFDACCHPLLATETLANNRKPECTPNSLAYSSAIAAEPTSTVTTPADYDVCDDNGNVPSVPASTPASDSTTFYPSPPVSTPVSTPETFSHTSPTYTPSPPPVSTPAPPVSTPETSSHTSSTPKASPSPSSGSSLFTGGFATYFYQNGVAGACGTVHSDSDLIAAMDQQRYGDPGKVSSLCGKQVKITNHVNSKSVIVTVADDCPTCINENSIDLSVAAFTQIATEAEGQVEIVWEYL